MHSIKQRFAEIDDEMTKKDETHRVSMHSRCHIGQNNTLAFPASTKSTTTPKPANTMVADNPKQDKVTAAKEQPATIRGPKKRIPRPTSMLRPKLIGKSVEGSAMQAVTASRLRARASSRPLPPQRSVSGGKSPASNAPPKEKKTKKTSSASKDAGKTSSSRILPRTSQTKLIRDISLLLRSASTPACLKLNQSSIQSMLLNFLESTKKNTDSQSLTRVFSTCYGNYLGSYSIELLQCDNKDTLALSFLEQILKRFNSINTDTVQLGRGNANNSIAVPIFLAKQLVSSAAYQATILLQPTMAWDCNRKAYAFAFRAWLVTGRGIDANKKSGAYAPQRNVNQDIALIEELVEVFVVSKVDFLAATIVRHIYNNTLFTSYSPI